MGSSNGVKLPQPVEEALAAAGNLAGSVSWALEDLAYCPPDDEQRRLRAWSVVRDALVDFQTAMEDLHA